jgi:hypothetical protein
VLLLLVAWCFFKVKIAQTSSTTNGHVRCNPTTVPAEVRGSLDLDIVFASLRTRITKNI